MWASRDNGYGADGLIYLWKMRPKMEAGRWMRENEYVGRLIADEAEMLGLALKPGQCVEIEDIKLVRKAKPIKAKHNFKFSEPGAKLEGGGIKGKRGVETVKRKRELPNKWWAVCIGGDSWNVNQSKRFATAIFKIAIKRGLTAEIFPVSVCRCGPTRQPRRRAK